MITINKNTYEYIGYKIIVNHFIFKITQAIHTRHQVWVQL